MLPANGSITLNERTIMGDATPGQQSVGEQDAIEDVDEQHAVEDAAIIEQEPERGAKPGPPSPGDSPQENKPESKFHG
jgi:hypothetical protein